MFCDIAVVSGEIGVWGVTIDHCPPEGSFIGKSLGKGQYMTFFAVLVPVQSRMRHIGDIKGKPRGIGAKVGLL